MKRTPKGYPRDERFASLIDSDFEETPSCGGVCVREYDPRRSRTLWVCSEWGCRDSRRVANRRSKSGKEWSRRDRLARCQHDYCGVCKPLQWHDLRHMASFTHYSPTDDYVERAWRKERSATVLGDIARSTGQGLAADLILASRGCEHVEFCSACCDALRAVLRVPNAADLKKMAEKRRET